MLCVQQSDEPWEVILRRETQRERRQSPSYKEHTETDTKDKIRLGAVVQAYNLSYSGD